MAQFNTLADLSSELTAMAGHSTEYWEKQVHVVPKSITVDRIDFLQKLCSGKTILNIGCTGKLDDALTEVATKSYGIDKETSTRSNYASCDLDNLFGFSLPAFFDVDLVICGEVLEHLSNPGQFLKSLHNQYKVPTVFTVPNAFAKGASRWLMAQGRENVNKDHVAYYSYTTLKELLRRARYELREHYWYGGACYVSEGLIALTRPI